MISVDPEADLVDQCMKVGGKGHRIGQVTMSYDPHECKAREFALRFKFGVSGWKVMPELPGPVNFNAASQNVTFDDLSDGVATGPDPQVLIEADKKSWMLGFDRSASSRSETTKDGSPVLGRGSGTGLL
jgi:hypothetical protein